jgi:hypothetical protein
LAVLLMFAVGSPLTLSAMTLTIPDEAPTPVDLTGGPVRSTLRRRRLAMTIWAVGFIAYWFLLGLPLTDPILAFLWLWAGTVAWRIDRPRQEHLRFAKDWIAVVVLLEAYNFSRGFADEDAIPHVMEMVAADRAMLGWFTGGEVPTIWLQQHLYDPDGIHWWDMIASWVYFSHFVATPGIAAILWVRNRARFSAFTRRWFLLSASGLATYFLYPAAPPWWAARYGLLEPVARISGRAWNAIGLHGAGNVLNAGAVRRQPGRRDAVAAHRVRAARGGVLPAPGAAPVVAADAVVPARDDLRPRVHGRALRHRRPGRLGLRRHGVRGRRGVRAVVGAHFAGPGRARGGGERRGQGVGLVDVAVLADHVQPARRVDVHVRQPQQSLDRALHHPYALRPRQRRDHQAADQPAVPRVHHLPVVPDRQQLVAQRR